MTFFQGDSGGPLASPNADNKIVVNGVTSFGNGDTCYDKAGFARVSVFKDWIVGIVQAADVNT